MMSESYYEGYSDREDGLEPFMENEYSGQYEDYWLGYNEANTYYRESDNDDLDDSYYDDEFDLVDSYDDDGRYDEDAYWNNY